MRKIEARDIFEKKDSRNKVIISIALVALLVFSTAGYAFYSSDSEETEKVDYNGFEFVRNNGFWDVIVEGQGFSFQNLPNETLDVEINFQKSFSDFSNKPLYVSEYSLATQEILMNIGAYLQRVQLACTQEPCEGDLPVKNCSDNNFIVFEQGEINKVSKEENCIYILYKPGEETKVSDAFLYRIIGVN